MASNPPFDNRFFVGGISNQKYTQLFGDSSGNPLVNRAVQGSYQIGSTMKMITSVAALNSHILPYANYTIDDNGKYVIPGCVPDEPSGCEKHNAGGALYGKINLPEALTVSSDVYFYGLGNDMWTKSQKGQYILQDEARHFGFGDAVGHRPAVRERRRAAGRGGEGEAGRGRGDLARRRASSATRATTSSSPSARACSPSRRCSSSMPTPPSPTAARTTGRSSRLNVLSPGTPDAVQPGLGRPQPGQRRAVASTPRRPTPSSLDPSVRRPDPAGPRRRDPQLRERAQGHRRRAVPAPTTTRPSRSRARPAPPRTPAKLSENDTSLFVGFGPIKPNTPAQYTIGAVLEKAGFGSWSAAPVVRCMFEALSGQRPMADPIESEPLNKDAATTAAVLPPLSDTSCLVNPPTDIND